MAKPRYVKWGPNGVVNVTEAIEGTRLIYPKAAPQIIATLARYFHSMDQNQCIETAKEELREDIDAIAEALYPEYFQSKREREAKDKIRRAEWRAQQKKKIPNGLRKQVFERDAYRCRKCGDHQDLCADHVIPECEGGSTTFDNLQTLCRPCNSAKGKKSQCE